MLYLLNIKLLSRATVFNVYWNFISQFVTTLIECLASNFAVINEVGEDMNNLRFLVTRFMSSLTKSSTFHCQYHLDIFICEYTTQFYHENAVISIFLITYKGKKF